MFAELNAVEFRGVYPRAEVTLAAEIENTAVKDARPVLSRVNTLVVAVLSENEIPVTKLFAFVVSIYEELIVTDVAVDDSVTLVPATKFVGPKGTYPKALVILAALNAAEFRGVYPSVLMI